MPFSAAILKRWYRRDLENSRIHAGQIIGSLGELLLPTLRNAAGIDHHLHTMMISSRQDGTGVFSQHLGEYHTIRESSVSMKQHDKLQTKYNSLQSHGIYPGRIISSSMVARFCLRRRCLSISTQIYICDKVQHERAHLDSVLTGLTAWTTRTHL